MVDVLGVTKMPLLVLLLASVVLDVLESASATVFVVAFVVCVAVAAATVDVVKDPWLLQDVFVSTENEEATGAEAEDHEEVDWGASYNRMLAKVPIEGP